MRRNRLISRERAAGVLGDRQAEAAGVLPFFTVNLRRRVAGAARREAHGQQAVVRCAEPFALHPRDVVEVGGLFGLLLQVAAVAVGKARANAAVAQRAQVGVGVPAVDNVMRPIVNRRQSGIDRFGNAEPGAVVGVLGRHHRSEPAHDRKIIEVAVGDHAAGEAAPEMKMGIDEAGAGDAVAAVDDLGARRIQVRADGDERAVTHMDVAVGYIAQLGVHGDDVGVAHDKLAARRQLSGAAVCRPQFG